MGRRFDDLSRPGTFGCTPRGERLTALGAISPDELQARLQRLEPDQEASRPRLVGGIGGGDLDRQPQPERIHEHMPCPPLDLFAPIIAFDAARFFRVVSLPAADNSAGSKTR